MSAHAKLSPSSASRWMKCSPSAELEKGFPNTTSSFAEEGTLAHAICEDMLRVYHDQISQKTFEAKMEVHSADKYFNDEMMEHCQDYVDFVNLSACEEGVHIFIEQKLDMSNYIPDGFGTGDCLVIKDRVLKFFDLKYGKGVKVSAVDNSQLKIYALGALNDYGHVFEVETVELNIFQPRIDGASSWSISVKDLLHWADTELKHKAEQAYNGEGEFSPGDNCKFCKAKARCRALMEHNMKLAEMAFKDPSLLELDELTEVLEKESLFTNWIGAVKDYVMSEALGGAVIPGYKLVEGRSVRTYSDQTVVETKLLAEGFTEIYTPAKLVGITELTKRLGKSSFETIVAPLLVRPSGKPTLVPESDKRAPMVLTDAATAFDDGVGETGDLI